MKSQIFWLLLWLALPLWGQNDFYKNHSFTQADTLRGKLLPERSCYDVHYYQLNIRVNPDEKFLQGQVAIHFTAERDFERLQIDLYREMTIAAISFEDQALDYERRANAVLVNMPRLLLSGEQAVLHITYGGKPQSAVDPPWQEGFVWSEDGRGRPWVGVACEGAGASLWWPCKDHLSDEPDSCQVQVSVPEGLMAVSNGNLQSVDTLGNGYVRYDWRVSYPINNYNITLNIAPYVQFSDHYQMGNGESLALDYYVLPNNLARARRHFRQIPKVLEAFEYYFGPYPFPRDGFAMVDAPFLGMEHQGAIAYGNDYQRGYLGYMALDHMDWDYVIVHETAHEYFGNSISCKDLGEMWIHESFATYMEALFVEYEYGYKDAIDFMESYRYRPYIHNEEPILGPLDVNWENWEHNDHYYKGAWMLHSLRHSLQNDEMWFGMLRALHDHFCLQTIHGQDIINFVNDFTGKDFNKFFEQYLRYPDLPRFAYRLSFTPKGWDLHYRWENVIDGFSMPLLVGDRHHYEAIQPTKEWQTMRLPYLRGAFGFKIATELFLIDTRREY